MSRRSLVTLVVLLVSVASGEAQDILTIGTGSAPPGGVVSVPVSVRDSAATPLGSDTGGGNRIQGIAFKVTYATELVASVTFARAGVIAAGAPMYETTLQGSGFRSFIVSFLESSPIAFTLNAAAPGNQIGTLTVTLQPQAASGSAALLTLDPPSATLSNQAGSIRETVANGNLALVNGSVTVIGTLPAPTGLLATAISTSQVNATWSAVPNADGYEVWRSSNHGAFALAGSPMTASFSDSNLDAGTTYLYRVRAMHSIAADSEFSNVDPATTILFTDDPLAPGTLVKAIHMTELRTAVNAMRASVSLAPLAPDATLAVGADVRAQHINDLRAGVAAARVEIGVPEMTFTDTLTPGATPIKALHIEELRNSVK